MAYNSEKTLLELVSGKLTDKNTCHSYISFYQDILQNIRSSAKDVLEVGIYNGGSIALWAEYFSNAYVYAMDISPQPGALESLAIYGDKVKCIVDNAYTLASIEKMRAIGPFDFIIDDGPHTLDSMLFMASEYSHLLSHNGIMIIEDIQDIRWCETIKKAFPQELQEYVSIHDIRYVKGRYDDIFMVLDKRRISAI